MSEKTLHPIYRRDYTPPNYGIHHVDLNIHLYETHALVISTLEIERFSTAQSEALVLQGEDMVLEEAQIDGRVLEKKEYECSETHLTFPKFPQKAILRLTTRIEPQNNTALEGLYRSGSTFCTQCESHGFHKITYFLDRPDVMASYVTTIHADRKKYPVLLSNGNPVASGEEAEGRHWVRWVDPFKKPCYLFALVAGDLSVREDSFTTQSGRMVQLKIFVEHGQVEKTLHAMESLKRAMQWDEKAYGREYDLDIFMIVAVSDFNMGAMENKGLNIFNARYILADSLTATDSDYEAIEAVVAHEYFHNWTGDRITCRDWFQLSLKESLTVFREQQFSADMGSAALKRISEVDLMRTVQFSEDAGPLAHPVRPDSYVEMNNFYTVTVYEKGAEVIRLLHTFLGAAGFRKGMDLYFDRHDGQAVTCDDFVKSLADANEVDLQPFMRWYSQAGTPVVTVRTQYDAAKKTYTLHCTQETPATPGQSEKHPVPIPLSVALLSSKGEMQRLQLTEKTHQHDVLLLTEAQHTFVFENVSEKPVPSLLRGFSAPVKLVVPEQTLEELEVLLRYDNDAVNRWDAAQRVALDVLSAHIHADAKTAASKTTKFVEMMQGILTDHKTDPALRAYLISLPSEEYIGDHLDEVDVEGIVRARHALRLACAKHLCADLLKIYEQLVKETAHYQFTPEACNARALKNTCLSYLMRLEDETLYALAKKQYEKADNMTDRLAALRSLMPIHHPLRAELLADFYKRHEGDALVINKWFSLQAMADIPDALAEVRALLNHPAFEYKNPNKVRALIGGFAHLNFSGFHAANGEGYAFLGEQVILVDALNPQVAARLCEPFMRWRRFDKKRQGLMQAQLQAIAAHPKISKNVAEIVHKALA